MIYNVTRPDKPFGMIYGLSGMVTFVGSYMNSRPKSHSLISVRSGCTPLLENIFPDANHRTAIALLRRLLRENGIDLGIWPSERTTAARDESHDVRGELPQIRFDTMFERDALYDVWESYFEDVLDVDCCGE